MVAALGSSTGAAQPRLRFDAGVLPALLVLAVGLCVLVLRPPLPIDETRYLEVFRESLRGGPLLLRLCGEPYAEKPPLLFWLGRALCALGLPPDVALRCVPALAAALTVFFVARLGARTGTALAGWLQAVLLLASLAGQALTFDALLAAAVWGALDAWARGRDRQATLWSAAALLAKGPVAYLFLVPFVLGLAGLRPEHPEHPARTGLGKRALLVLLLALLPLAGWALAAAARGGPEFANALLWERWAGRVAGAVHHAQPVYFYLPVVLLGALPATPVLFARSDRARPEWMRHTGRALLVVLVLFSLIRAKQPHYLVPAAPALALLVAWKIEGGARAVPWLRRGIGLQLALLAALALSLGWILPRLEGSYGARGQALVASGRFAIPLALMALVSLTGLALLRRRSLPPRALLLVALASSAALLPLHWLVGELVYPHALAGALRAGPGPVAYFGTSRHGLYHLLAPADEIVKLGDESELAPWCARHPDGLLLVDPAELRDGLPQGLVTVARDVVHRGSVVVLRAGASFP